MKERYHLAGPYDFVIESANPISFSDNLTAKEIWASVEPGDHVLGKATHGSCPERKACEKLAAITRNNADALRRLEQGLE